ncbi:hypothetical protein [Streptomyces sp. NPDC001508]|uniref:hypothetical protein n=1 Tax=Streptomyces sp. NPDC001508 TaxID=3154656 RepID=UPI00331C03BD
MIRPARPRAGMAGGVVHSRSGLPYQAEPLEKAGPIIRAPDDDHATAVPHTEAGLALTQRSLPVRIQLAPRLLLDCATSATSRPTYTTTHAPSRRP